MKVVTAGKGMKAVRIFLVWVAAALACACPVEACSVPVFRYALERWGAEPYVLTVFHRGPLSAAEQAAVDFLVDQTQNYKAPANLVVETVDLNTESPGEVLELWKSLGDVKLPCMALRYPENFGNPAVVVSAPLSRPEAEALLHSPVRRGLARAIVEGDTAVWVLLDSGEAAKDAAAATLVRQELAKLEKNLVIEPMLPEDVVEDVKEAVEALKVRFSFLRLSRKDAAERALVAMMLHSEPDLLEQREPVVFVVFGRGRLLPALVGRGITAMNIQEVAQFLVGPCTCIVKEMNPGVDLLIAVDWDALPEGPLVKPAVAPELTGIPEKVVPVEETTPEQHPVGRTTSGVVTWAVLVSAGVIVLGVVVATLVITRKKKSGAG